MSSVFTGSRVPMFRSVRQVLARAKPVPVAVAPIAPAVVADTHEQSMLRIARNTLHNARIDHAAAERCLANSSLSSLPATKYSKVVEFTPERVQQRYASALASFNRSAERLAAAEQAVAVAQAACQAAQQVAA